MPYDHFMTDPDVINAARDVMGSIDFDPASNDVAQHYVRATTYCVAPDCDIVSAQGKPAGTRLVDGLACDWYGTVWCNPPYSRGNINKFITYGINEWYNGHVDQLMFLVNSSTDTEWYHSLLRHSRAVCFWSGRIKFWKICDGKAHRKWVGELSKQKGLHKEGNSPRFLNSLFYFARTTAQVLQFRTTFDMYGTVVTL